MNGEPSRSISSSTATPVKVIRDVKGLLSLQNESPSQSDVVWNSIDSPRVVGGKSKSLKSSNQLTPKNNVIRRKYYSSPVLVARVAEEINKKTEKRSSSNVKDNKRVLEEFQRQFNNENNYVPRNLLDNLSEELEDSIIVSESENKRDIKDNEDEMSDYEYNFSDDEDLAALAMIEEEARRMLEEKIKEQNKISVQSAKTISTNIVEVVDKPKVVTKPSVMTKSTVEVNKTKVILKPTDIPKPSVNQALSSKKTIEVSKKNNYFDSDDDDIILSIPLEKLSGECSTNNANKKNQLSSNANKNVKSDLNKYIHTSVIPAKREYINTNTDINRIQNQSNPKPIIQSNLGTVSATAQEPLAKRRCTAEEIAEKRRQAMLRREEYLRNLRATQK